MSVQVNLIVKKLGITFKTMDSVQTGFQAW